MHKLCWKDEVLLAQHSIARKLFCNRIRMVETWLDLWNYSLQSHTCWMLCATDHRSGKRAPWEDPAQFILRTYPWSKNGMQNLNVPGISVCLTQKGRDQAQEINMTSYNLELKNITINAYVYVC